MLIKYYVKHNTKTVLKKICYIVRKIRNKICHIIFYIKICHIKIRDKKTMLH